MWEMYIKKEVYFPKTIINKYKNTNPIEKQIFPIRVLAYYILLPFSTQIKLSFIPISQVLTNNSN